RVPHRLGAVGHGRRPGGPGRRHREAPAEVLGPMSATAEPPPDRLAGHRALVTGGASGIGAAIASRLAAEGAAVVIGAVDDATSKATAEQCGATPVHLDVSDPVSARAAV